MPLIVAERSFIVGVHRLLLQADQFFNSRIDQIIGDQVETIIREGGHIFAIKDARRTAAKLPGSRLDGLIACRLLEFLIRLEVKKIARAAKSFTILVYRPHHDIMAKRRNLPAAALVLDDVTPARSFDFARLSHALL